jgi:DNA-directed RNA polymerase beta subunit
LGRITKHNLREHERSARRARDPYWVHSRWLRFARRDVSSSEGIRWQRPPWPVTKVRNFAKRGDAIAVPDLTKVQSDGYERFLQLGQGPDERDIHVGLESLLREVFPIESYDGTMRWSTSHYVARGAPVHPRRVPRAAADVRPAVPHRVRCARGQARTPEEEIYLGEFPIMMGGGEFIVNGAERVIVSQLHRSPGVDFSIVSSEATARCTRPASSPSAARGSSWR